MKIAKSINYYSEKLRELLKQYNLDVIIIYANTYNDRYMKAITGTHAILQNFTIITEQDVHITETHYLRLDLQRRTKTPVIQTEGEDFGNIKVREKIGLNKRIGIIGDIKYVDITMLKPKKVIDLTKETNAIIRYKSDDYIQELTAYARLAAKIMYSVSFMPGSDILDQANKIFKKVLKAQCILSFPTCITTGKDLYETTTIIASSKKVQTTDIACIDMGLKKGMFTTDMTRMFFVNNSKAKKLYKEIVQKHNKVIQTFVSPKRTFREIIEEYKRVFKKSEAQVQEYDFGHGVGFALHEKPIIEVDDKETVGTNIVFTLEPTFHTPYGKMRIEDMLGIFSDGTVTNLTG